ncbi:MAG: hypothetical protein HOG25_13540, partial [Gammaproteobacteria bacterium]|nr:hypothetical protein [Gammaproteobacteria bacterium]
NPRPYPTATPVNASTPKAIWRMGLGRNLNFLEGLSVTLGFLGKRWREFIASLKTAKVVRALRPETAVLSRP